MNDTDIHKLTGAYATDAIDEIERARFEQHLASCEDCRAEVAELREVGARLAEATATPAPASLRSSVLAGISQVRPLPPVTPTFGGDHEQAAVHAPVPAASPETPDPHAPTRLVPRSQRRGLRRWMPMVVAAVLVLVAGVALTSQPWADDERQLTVAERVLQAPDAEEVAVDLGDGGQATVVRSKSVDRAVIVTEDMAPAPEGRVHELWFQSPEEEMVPAGLMPDGEDNTVVLEGSAAEAIAVGITVEPEGGSETPTTEPIAIFPLDQST